VVSRILPGISEKRPAYDILSEIYPPAALPLYAIAEELAGLLGPLSVLKYSSARIGQITLIVKKEPSGEK